MARDPLNGLADSLRALGMPRLIAMGAVAVAVLGMLALVAFHGTPERMALLYGDLDLRESAQMADLLDHDHIAHQIGDGGSEILVDAGEVPRARLLLAKEGLPTGGSVGYEIFDRSDSLTTTEFQQRINLTRALEGELVRSIRELHGVRNARVHLVLPRREPFSRDAQKAQASVLLTMNGAQVLDREGVQAVLNLVAAAVPGLRPQDIAIIDSRGDLLARAGEPVGSLGVAQTSEELRHTTQMRLSRAVEQMLESIVGPGHVRAEASVDMSFSQEHETDEKYDPDGQVARSTQTVTDTSKNIDKAAPVTVKNDLPNADAGQSHTGSQHERREETTNYEISKTVRTIVDDQPHIRRITLAVMVDGQETRGPGGKLVWTPRSPAEPAQMTDLVRAAIGYDPKRGDKVDVTSMRFRLPEDMSEDDTPTFLQSSLGDLDLMRLAQLGVFALIAALAVLTVLRPMARRLAMPTALEGGEADQALLASTAGGDLRSRESAILAAGQSGVGLLEDESMIDLANIEGQIRASSIRQIADLAEKHPEQTLAIVRGWMLQEQS